MCFSDSELCVQEAEMRPLKRSTGIPNSFMTVVENVNQPGVMVNSSGQLAVPTIDAYVSLPSILVTASLVSKILVQLYNTVKSRCLAIHVRFLSRGEGGIRQK